MQRIVLVGRGRPERGGLSAFLHQLHDHLAASGADVRLLNLTRPQGPREGGRVTAGNLRRTGQDALAVWRAARGADVVHVHSAVVPLVTLVRAGLLGLAGRLRGARVVVHAHGGPEQLAELDRGWRRRVARAAYRTAEAVVAVSVSARPALQRLAGPDRVVLIENGVDTARFAPGPRDHDPPRIVYAGILTPRKGVVDLIRASAILRDRGVDHEVVLVGGAPDEGPAAEQEVRRAAGPEVTFAGTRDHEQMPDAYADADVFCLPSWWEAMPLSVLEAMASGLPVVATRVGDVPRMVVDGTGSLVDPRDPEALADALEPLLRDGEHRRAVGDAARDHVEQHRSAARTLTAVDRLYARLAGDTTGAG